MAPALRATPPCGVAPATGPKTMGSSLSNTLQRIRMIAQEQARATGSARIAGPRARGGYNAMLVSGQR
ncbi:hypothetical protein ACFX12_002166 [Malus domestica]